MLEDPLFGENLQALSKKNYVPMNVRFYLNKVGKKQIYLSVTSNGKRIRIPLDLYIKPEDWDNIKQRAKNKTDGYESINLILDQAFSKISDISMGGITKSKKCKI